MDTTRLIYWNVGHGVVLPMYLFAFITLAILVYGFVKRIPVYRLGKPLRAWITSRSPLAGCEKGFGQLRVMLVSCRDYPRPHVLGNAPAFYRNCARTHSG